MLEAKDFADLSNDVAKLEEQIQKLKEMESNVYKEQKKYAAEMGKRRQQFKNLRRDATTPESKAWLQSLFKSLDALEKKRPTSTPWFLWTTLGSTNFILPEGHKVAYKTEYEFMKIQGTTVHLALSCVQLFVDWTLLDSLSNFLLLYLYSTMTVREHLLLANGSHIRFWWIAHHYLFIGISATILIWPAGPSYESMRSVLISISVIIGAVQLLQYRYQLKRLYTLRALSKVDNMEVTTDAEHLHLTTGLFFLLPFLFLGHSLQFYVSYRFFALAVKTAYAEWQVWTLACLFLCLASGNAITTLWTVYSKYAAGTIAKLKQQ